MLQQSFASDRTPLSIDYKVSEFELHCSLKKGYGMEYGTFCGVFDGHGTNGHTVSKLVRNRLPSLLLNQMNDIAKYNTISYNDKDFEKWKEACVSAFRVMDKEIKLMENIDCACSGSTAVTVTKQASF